MFIKKPYKSSYFLCLQWQNHLIDLENNQSALTFNVRKSEDRILSKVSFDEISKVAGVDFLVLKRSYCIDKCKTILCNTETLGTTVNTLGPLKFVPAYSEFSVR